jgi:pimeloyl-ACP methyl ester carboxylesterase
MGSVMVTSGRIPVNCVCHSPCINLGYMEQGSGEAVVLIHGLGANADSWRPQLEALAKNYRVVAMDLRGHGQSGFRVEEPITIRAFADDVVALMNHLEIEAAHWVGISMGGMIALEIFVRYGLQVKSLVLASTAAFFPPPQGQEELLRHFDRLEMVEWGQLMAGRVLRRQAGPEPRREVAQMLAANRRNPYRQGLIASFASDYRWVLPQIDVPTLILAGEEDQATPLGYARYLHRNIEGSVLQVISRAAHFTNLENPGEFNWQVGAHLKRFQSREQGSPVAGRQAGSTG